MAEAQLGVVAAGLPDGDVALPAKVRDALHEQSSGAGLRTTKLRMKISGVLHSALVTKDMVAESAAPLASPRPIVAPTSEDVARVHLNVHCGGLENVLCSGDSVEPGRNCGGQAVGDELTARWNP